MALGPLFDIFSGQVYILKKFDTCIENSQGLVTYQNQYP